MPKPRKRQLLGADRAAGALGGFHHDHRPAGLRQADRGSEPVRPAADDDGVAHAICSANWCNMLWATWLSCPQNACWAC